MRLDLGDILLDAAMEVESTVGIEPAGDAPPLWTPLPPQPGRGIMLPDGRVLSPQQLAVETPADETFFGGGGGGGKSHLLLGLAATRHRNSIIFRREFTQFRGAEGLIQQSINLIGDERLYNRSLFTWRKIGGFRSLEFGAAKTTADMRKYRGRPHDMKAFDELPEFPEEVYRFLIGWLRTAHVGQRTRVMATGNPPVDDSSQWIKDYWAPWLRKGHPNPAQQGELRWYVSDAKGKDIEVPGPKWGNERAEAVMVNGKAVLPRSRTFIQSVVEDNPIYMETGYAAVLDSLPEPYRSSMRHGDFTASTPDDPLQVIPTAWVVAAQDRWTADGGRGPLSMVGNDPSRGGQDEFVIAKRYDDWVAPLVIHAASEAPDGPTGALLVYRAMDGDRKDVPVQVDVIGSAGSSVYDHAKSLGLQVVALNGAEASSARDRSGKLGFVNKRAEWHWKMRELLDPAYGATLALPPDPQLRADLCAPRWSYRTRVQIEPKDDIKARIGRSPDRGEAVMYACVLGDARGAFGLLFDAASTDDVKALEDEVAELERRLSGRSA